MSCHSCRREKANVGITNVVEEWINKEIKFDNEYVFTRLGKDSVYNSIPTSKYKIVVSTMRAKDFHGEELAEMLRKNYHLEMEMTAPEYVIAMTSVLDTDEGFERLTKALLEIDEELLKAEER